MKSLSFWLQEKLWITPALYIVMAILLSIALYYVDLLYIEELKPYIPAVILTNVDLAKTIMGSLAGSLLTMTTFTFSTILVVLTMYSSQFSPRTLKNFIHDKIVWRVLGIFLSGFIYNTLSLLFMRDDLYETDVLSTFVGIVIAFFCLSTFAYFIHYIATNVQVGQLINHLIADTEQAISKIEELQKNEGEQKTEWYPVGIKETHRAEKEGYVQYLSFSKLVDYAEEQKLKVEILVETGDYVYEGKPLFHIFKVSDEELSIGKFYSLGTSRTSEQDISFAIQKLVEVALRAISPGINDPNTANEIIIRLGRLLGQLGQLKTGPFLLGEERVLYRFPVYKSILYKTFYQLSHYGKEDVSVLITMLESLKVAAEIAPQQHHQELWETHAYILEGVDNEELKSFDHEALQEKVDQLAKATGQHSYNLLLAKEN
ncbi:hypothetical protein A1A1_01633 [Planococcus antarcticus DSM 14505]|uniref:DUF2254 domain-containing protein n=1 Tax=Planococcus antarcticus DSM 14505 TaxID=1185653 RepID=A0A1C7DJH3_9BACL|nr:DUF2254 domain-containing protein [Planococcus antarcticus]ANU11656.1 hypothetical protein BBH88_15930 [Planococcus antarcticus DSM 14505]EIM08284.1 hypothetical protein A1A1_01633 [Planococcus antarcticus DSM 14505]